MGFIPDVTCRRCGRKYSSLRGKCPHCGTRKESQSSRAPAETEAAREGTPSRARADANLKWQMIFGGILTVAIILAVIVLITFNIGERNPKETPSPSMSTESPSPPPTESPTPSPSPTIVVTSVTISFFANQEPDYTIKMSELLEFTATVYPEEVKDLVVPVWISANEEVFTLEPAEDGKTSKIVPVAPGSATLRVEAGGAFNECIIRIVDG